MKKWHDTLISKAIKEKESDLIPLIQALFQDRVPRNEVLKVIHEEFTDTHSKVTELLNESISNQLKTFLEENFPEPEAEKQTVHILMRGDYNGSFVELVTPDLQKAEDELHKRSCQRHNDDYYYITSHKVEN